MENNTPYPLFTCIHIQHERLRKVRVSKVYIYSYLWIFIGCFGELRSQIYFTPPSFARSIIFFILRADILRRVWTDYVTHATLRQITLFAVGTISCGGIPFILVISPSESNTGVGNRLLCQKKTYFMGLLLHYSFLVLYLMHYNIVSFLCYSRRWPNIV